MACAASSSFWVLRTLWASSSSLWASAPTNSMRSDRSDSVVEPRRNSTLVPGPAMNASAARSSRRDCTCSSFSVASSSCAFVVRRLAVMSSRRASASSTSADLTARSALITSYSARAASTRSWISWRSFFAASRSSLGVAAPGIAATPSTAASAKKIATTRNAMGKEGCVLVIREALPISNRGKVGNPADARKAPPRLRLLQPSSDAVARCLSPPATCRAPGRGGYLPRSAASSGSRRAWRQW